MHTEGHDMGKDAVGNTPPAAEAPKFDAEHPGYETTDVNVGGVAVFLAGLFGTVIVFFFVCYAHGQGSSTIFGSSRMARRPSGRWLPATSPAGQGRQPEPATPRSSSSSFAQVVSNFPEPRLDIDDGNQATADLHAREDLLLDYTTARSTGSRARSAFRSSARCS